MLGLGIQRQYDEEEQATERGRAQRGAPTESPK
jgi:hypothetical protein